MCTYIYIYVYIYIGPKSEVAAAPKDCLSTKSWSVVRRCRCREVSVIEVVSVSMVTTDISACMH